MTEPRKFVPRNPPTVEAMQFDGSQESADAIELWLIAKYSWLRDDDTETILDGAEGQWIVASNQFKSVANFADAEFSERYKEATDD